MIPNCSSSVDWQRWRAVAVWEGGGMVLHVQMDLHVLTRRLRGAGHHGPIPDRGPGTPALKNWLNRLTKFCILAI